MEPITAEAANAFLRWLIEGEPLAPGDSVPWAPQRPLLWAEFLATLTRYCKQRGWEITSDGPSHFSLTIFGHDDETKDEAEARQGRLPFEDEAPPL